MKRFKAGSILLIVGFVLLSSIATSLSPFFTQKAEAALANATNINLEERGKVLEAFSNGYPINTPFVTCKPEFVLESKNQSLLEQHFFGDAEQVPGFPTPTQAQIQEFQPRLSNSLIGNFDNPDGTAMLRDYVYKAVGSSNTWVINFRPTDNLSQPVDGGGRTNRNGSVDPYCGQYKMIQVAQYEWRGFQAITGSTQRINIPMIFKLDPGAAKDNAHGTLEYYHYNSDLSPEVTKKITSNITVSTYPDPSQAGGGGPSTGETAFPQWVDASTVKFTFGRFNGETYKKYTWGKDDVSTPSGTKAYSFYFLDSTPENSPRAGMTWSSGKGCENPMPNGSPGVNCVNGVPNCVPFIAVQRSLALGSTDTNLQHLNDEANALGTSTAFLYDYNPTDCRQDRIVEMSWRGSALGPGLDAQVWLYYSAKNDAFQPVWIKGHGNEQPLIGTYTKVAGIYQGGANGCNGTISIDSFQGNHLVVTWTLKDFSRGGCGNPTLYGNLAVLAIAGPEGEAKFEEINNIISNLPPPGAGENELRIGCDYFENALSWLICPFVRGAMNLIEGFDGIINKLLTISTPEIFSDSTATGQAYHTAWGIFRTLALSLIVIAALVMVVSQAAWVIVVKKCC